MKKVITLFTLSFLCFLLANGQNWKHLGNLPVVPNSVFKDGQVMYASTNSDFLMSEDGGQTWESKMKIPIQDSIIAIYSGQEKLNWLKGIFYKEIQFLQKGYLTCCFGNGRIAINQQNLNTLDETFVSGIFTGGRTPTYIDGVFKKDDQTYIISTNTVGQIYDLTVTTDGGQTWHKAAEQRHYPIGWINDQLVMGPVDFNNVPLSIKIRNEVDAHDSFTVPMPPNEGRYFVEDGLIYSISRKDDKTITICDIDPYSGNAWSCTDFDSGIDIPTYGAIEWYLFGGAVFYHVNTFENGEHGREFWRKSSIKDQSDFEKIDIGVDLKGHAAELHTTSPNHLFLTTGQSKFYESTDAGVTWNEVQIEGPNPKSDSYNLEIKQNTPFVNINDENLHINSHSAPFSEDWRPVEFNIRDLDPNWELKKFEMTSWGGYLLAYENGGLYLWGGYDNAPMETMVEPISATPSEIGLNHYGYQSFYYTKEHSEMGEAYFGSGIFPPIKTGGVHRTKYLKSGLRILAANAQSGFYDYTLNEGETWNATTLSANENLKIDIITGDLYYFHGKTLFRSLDHGDNFEEFELTEFFNPFVHFSPRRYNPDSELLIGNQVLRIVENRLYALKIGEDYYEKVNTPFVRAVDMDLTSSGKLYFQSLAEGVWSVDLFDILPPNGEKADLVVTSDPIYRIDTLQSGDRISNARFTVRNMGRDISGPSVIRWYVSKNESPDFGHSFRFFGSETISPLAPGASVEVSKPGLTVDENWDSGTYYFNAAVNLLSPQTEESDFTNNSAFQIFIKDYPSAPQANLRNKNFDNFYYEADAGTQFNFEQIIANAGNLRSGTTNVKYALSEDQIFDSSDFIFNDITTLPELRAAENYTSNITLEIPENIPSRTYYFLSIIDDENVISEIDENDNVSYFFLNVQGAV